jgi:hypothetical protein
MKLTKRRLPIPQNEFGFTPSTFNLFADFTSDGERIAREREQADKARQLAEVAQPALIQTKDKKQPRPVLAGAFVEQFW